MSGPRGEGLWSGFHCEECGSVAVYREHGHDVCDKCGYNHQMRASPQQTGEQHENSTTPT